MANRATERSLAVLFIAGLLTFAGVSCNRAGQSKPSGSSTQLDFVLPPLMALLDVHPNPPRKWTRFDGVYPDWWPGGMDLPQGAYVSGTATGLPIDFPTAGSVLLLSQKSHTEVRNQLLVGANSAGFQLQNELDQPYPAPPDAKINNWAVLTLAKGNGDDNQRMFIDIWYGPNLGEKTVYLIRFPRGK